MTDLATAPITTALPGHGNGEPWRGGAANVQHRIETATRPPRLLLRAASSPTVRLRPPLKNVSNIDLERSAHPTITTSGKDRSD
ncbi:hypothetical protein I4I84_18700 [Pseudonocardia sp. KRD-182]|uniref:hypothetical protein n=1 Tax=Pseudonocardia oceani TaxID=2792013 RepID=UPI001C49EBC7|nr:hypothetical protein [Pseudonocardia oceani]MBW0110751.1 hypothetical protein [Pseudonocardia oceani]